MVKKRKIAKINGLLSVTLGLLSADFEVVLAKSHKEAKNG